MYGVLQITIRRLRSERICQSLLFSGGLFEAHQVALKVKIQALQNVPIMFLGQSN
jgi:hypothetical protein